MKIISTTEARNMLPDFIESFKKSDNVFIIGRRNKPEAIIMKFPEEYNPKLSEITNINSYSSSFDFLKDEPEMYSLKDITE